MKQKFDNLPIELTKQKRFLLVGENKAPLTPEWQKPENQAYYTDLKGLCGFAITGDGTTSDYCVLDFDHVKNKNGEWINDYAKNTLDWIIQSAPTFIEQSKSEEGFHIILKPTPGKFEKIVNNADGTLYFEEGNKESKLEIFYKQERQFVLTGKNYQCEPQAAIASGIVADNVIEILLNRISKTKNPKRNEAPTHTSQTKKYITDSDYEKAKIERALEIFDPVGASYDEWDKVGMALKSESDNYITLWDRWSSRDVERYKGFEEIQKKWQSFKGSGITIKTLFKFAQDAGFEIEKFNKEWNQTHKPTQNYKSVDADHEAETQKAVEILLSVEDFGKRIIFSEKMLHAAAVCYLYAIDTFEDFRDKCSQHGIRVGLLDSKIKTYAEQEREHRRLDKLDAAKEMAKDETVDNDKLIEIINQSLERDSKGKVLQNTRNFNLILYNDPYIKNSVGFDAFNNRMTPLKKLPWQDKLIRAIAWSDSDDEGLQNYLDTTYNLRNEKIFKGAIDEYSHKHSYHPVRDFFNKGLPEWDGKPRAEKVFIDALDVEDSEYARKVSLHWLLGGVARIFHPGCKFDYTLVTKGKQGIGKSTILGKLSVNKDWFNDSLDSFEGKDALEQLQGSWIIEIGEMQATRKSENEKIKSFISRQVDEFRKSYGHRKEAYPRQCVFSATTNSEEFLKDRTGGRRFLILVSEAKTYTIKQRMAKFTKDYILQIWAEVYHIYNEMFKEGFDDSLLDIPANLKKIAKEYQERYTEGGALIGAVTEYLEKEFPINWESLPPIKRRQWIRGEFVNDSCYNTTILKKRDVISAHEIAYEMFNIDDPGKSRSTLNEIGEVIANLTDWRRLKTIKPVIQGYGRQRVVFERVKNNPFADD